SGRGVSEGALPASAPPFALRETLVAGSSPRYTPSWTARRQRVLIRPSQSSTGIDERPWGMRLLLIEDNARLATFVGRSLGRAGFAVDRVGSAGEADAVLGTIAYE